MILMSTKGGNAGTDGSPPRVRGGRHPVSQEQTRATGHPRACGADDDLARAALDLDRVTPARAGRTLTLAQVKALDCGSPPRVRGFIGGAVPAPTDRVTPARAGRTSVAAISVV